MLLGRETMKIFEKDGWIFIQLMDMTTKEMLMDFSVAKKFFTELRDHIIEHLNAFKIEEGDAFGKKFLEGIIKSDY